MSKYDLGLIGQHLALEHLEKQGYSIREQNYKVWGGELDIVAYDEHLAELVFVEVKTRSTNWMELDETFSSSKRQRMKKAIRAYLMRKTHVEINWRIDHIGIFLNTEKELVNLEHYINVN